MSQVDHNQQRSEFGGRISRQRQGWLYLVIALLAAPVIYYIGLYGFLLISLEGLSRQPAFEVRTLAYTERLLDYLEQPGAEPDPEFSYLSECSDLLRPLLRTYPGEHKLEIMYSGPDGNHSYPTGADIAGVLVHFDEGVAIEVHYYNFIASCQPFDTLPGGPRP